MDYHKNARLTAICREQLARAVVLEGCPLQAAAARFHVSAKTAVKWVMRHREHRFARLYHPQTNGKADCFIQTALREWAYARSYNTWLERENQLDPWHHGCSFHRPNASLNLNPPASRLGLSRNNLLRLHS
jgi:hypothetical protein